jgi:PhoH-like ATPase
MKKSLSSQIVVLDTSVLVHDPSAFKSFSGSTVIIPIIVLEELDKVKKLVNDSGRNARVAIKNLDMISERGQINLGVKIENDITIKIDTANYGAIGSDPSYGDNRILACVNKYPKQSVIFISKDINLRVRAKSLGLKAIDYNKDDTDDNDLFSGIRRIKNEEMGSRLLSDGELLSSEFKEVKSLHPNECMLLLTDNNKCIAVGRKMKDYLKIIKDQSPWGLVAKSPEQKLAIDMILDPKIALVSLVGVAGSGKSLISLACGLELVVNQRKYSTFSIYRPIQPVGSDIGYLPGSIQEKLSPHFASIDDGFAYLLSDKTKKKNGWKEQLFQFLDNGTIQKEALTYIRGRSIPNSLIMVDEVQNLSKEEIKTLLTRVGVGSKVILTGDITQIDHHGLDATNNGLSYVVEKFKDKELAGHVTFTKGERSDLASLSAQIL